MKLVTRQIAKPWGRTYLPAPFVNPGHDKIGEIWFEPEAGSALGLMIKYLFTSEKLSIQVHPCDAQAVAMGLPGGKEECWLVLDTEPGATLGIGTRKPLTNDELCAAALDGSIEVLMDWHPVRRGDFFYIPAGTVHAIGAGVSLIEIQQNADVTYRLYDYGRPRMLHLEKGVAVSDARPYNHQLQQHVDLSVDQMLVDGPRFHLRLTGDPNDPLPGNGPLIVVPVEGNVSVFAGKMMLSASPGECIAIDPNTPAKASGGARLLLARAN